MDKEEIESAMQKIIRESQDFREAPSYELAMELDKDLSILRFIIGEDNFTSLHYFNMVHDDVAKFIDKTNAKMNADKS